MANLFFITHPEVIIDPDVPIDKWSLSPIGQSRAKVFASSGILKNVSLMVSSEETKALETTEILSKNKSCEVKTLASLGENNRESTGFLPPTEFEDAANEFFANPDSSHLGWESARDAQIRIVAAVNAVLKNKSSGDVAVISHGAVGTLLYCALLALEIDRGYDQPGQGHYWSANLEDRKPRHHWLPIA